MQTYLVIVSGRVVMETSDEGTARSDAEAAAQSGQPARVATVIAECRVLPAPTWEEAPK